MNKKKGWKNYIKWLFGVILIFYPFLNVNVGVDITDTGFSLGNFLYEPKIGEEWFLFATYLANLIGTLLTKLPFGGTILGMNIYTSVFVSLNAVIGYQFLVKKIPPWIAFAGIFLAESLCWCPTIILYNYLSYFLFTILVIFLYKGLTQKRLFLFLAGIILGCSVMVRFPNLAQSAMILAVWYYGVLQKDKMKIILQNTFLCLGGFFTGIVLILIEISIQYGLSAYLSMVTHLLEVGSSSGEGHSLGTMLYSIVDAYFVAFRWMWYPIGYGVVGVLAFYLVRKNKILLKAGSILYGIGTLVLFRLLYGRGMFNFKYYTYESMFQWVAIFLILAILAMLVIIMNKNQNTQDRLLACMILLIILITPLGSDNYLYPIMNNLFLIAPVTFYFLFQFLQALYQNSFKINAKTPYLQPLVILLGMVLLITYLQSALFGYRFVFRDGTMGEPLNTTITQNEVLKGMVTSKQKAEMLESVTAFAKENQLIGKQVILFGNIPAISCFLEMPAALSSSWPDLATYRVTTMEQELEEIHENEGRPVVILSAAIGAWITEDAEEMTRKSITAEMYQEDEKVAILRGFMEENLYQETYANDEFVIYEIQ